jgi:decaprenyl-phosphate phosphoribosyltransferase
MTYFRLLRGKQWSKNALVFVAPFAAGNFYHWHILTKSILAFIAFCCIASVGYIVNDLIDIEQDRKNPKKAKRPLASGQIGAPRALIIAVVVAIAGLVISLYLPRSFQFTILAYFSLTLTYSLLLKHEPVVELMLVSSGFALRAIGGATATNTPTSKWFLMVATFGPLVIVTCKRISEAVNVPFENLRPTMKRYSPAFLRFVLTVAAGVTMTSYGLWAFSISTLHPYAAISIIPISIQLFRYVWLAESGLGEVPEDVIFKDRVIVISMTLTTVLVGLSIYVKH